ncbi:Tyrosine recombinase XerC [subsurface metagenome]
MSDQPKTLTVNECHLILTALLIHGETRGQRQRSYRNHCMAVLMLDAGLRVGELVQLRQRDLAFQDSVSTSVLISAEISKSRFERVVPLTSNARAAIHYMIDFLWGTSDPGPDLYAFYQKDPLKPLTTRQVERIIRSAALIALNRPVHPHVLRHTFATRLMRTTNTRIVQKLLGHRNLSSTQVYTHPTQEDLQVAINELGLYSFPVDLRTSAYSPALCGTDGPDALGTHQDGR